VYSDVLYNTYYCSTIDPSRWAQIDNVDKRKNLSTEDFISEYESKGIPVVIQDIVPQYVFRPLPLFPPLFKGIVPKYIFYIALVLQS
jgi:hypothetical protein